MRTEQERMELIRKRTFGNTKKKRKSADRRIIDMGCAAAVCS